MKGMRLIKSFLEDERGQALFEYILFAGGIILGTIVMFVKFSGMANASAGDMNAASEAYIDAATAEAKEIISQSL